MLLFSEASIENERVDNLTARGLPTEITKWNQ